MADTIFELYPCTGIPGITVPAVRQSTHRVLVALAGPHVHHEYARVQENKKDAAFRGPLADAVWHPEPPCTAVVP